MTYLTNFAQSATPVTLTAGENISQGDLVSAYPNGQAYYATSTSSGVSSYDPITGYLRPFFLNSSGAISNTHFGFTGNPYFNSGSYSNGIVYYAIKAVYLSNGNIAIAWMDNSQGAIMYCVMTPSGSTVVGNTVFRSSASTTWPLDICAIPGGGFAIVTGNNSSTYYVGSYTNTGTQNFSVSRTGLSYNTYAIKIAPIGTSGFVVVSGNNTSAGAGDVCPLTNTGTFGTPYNGIRINAGTSVGSNTNSNSDLMVLSNGNFAIINGGYTPAGYYPLWYIFSATTSTITFINDGTGGYSPGYAVFLSWAPDTSGGFFFLQTNQSGSNSGYNYLNYVNSSGATVSTSVFGSNTGNYGSSSMVVQGSSVYISLGGGYYTAVQLAQYNWNGTSFTSVATSSALTSNSANMSQMYVYLFPLGSGGVTAFFITPNSSSYGGWSPFTPSSNVLYQLNLSSSLSITSETVLSSSFAASSGFISLSLPSYNYLNGGGTLATSILLDSSPASYTPFLYTSNPALSIVPIGIAIAAATSGNPVTVQTTGTATTRLTFNSSWVNGNTSSVPGNKVELIGNSAIMYGIQNATATVTRQID